MIDMAIAEAPRREERRYKQRSWESAQHARDARALKKSQQQLALQTTAAEQAQRTVEAVATAMPVVARQLGLRVRKAAYSEEQARISMRLAFAPTIRSDPTARRTQGSAVAIVAAALREEQRLFCDGVLFSPAAGAGLEREGAFALEAGRPFVVHALDWQWDETSQKVKGCNEKRLQGERSSGGAVGMQVMMQHGVLSQLHKGRWR